MEKVLELREELSQKEAEMHEIKMKMKALQDELQKKRNLRFAAEQRAGFQESSSSSSFGGKKINPSSKRISYCL